MRKSKSAIDVCVLTAGARPDLLEKCLDSIQVSIEKSELPCSVYVFENGKQTRVQHPVVTWYKQTPKNVGFADGANRAIGMGSSDLVLFVSDDIELLDNTVSALYSRMKDATIGQVGLKLMFPLTSTDTSRPAGKIQHVGHSVTIHGDIIHPFVGWSATNPRCCKSDEVFSVTGAVFMVRRIPFQRVGMFNLEYGIGTWEDIELSLRIRQLGYKIFLDAEAQAYHHVGATAQQLQQPFPLDRNRQIFMARNRQFLIYDDWRRR